MKVAGRRAWQGQWHVGMVSLAMIVLAGAGVLSDHTFPGVQNRAAGCPPPDLSGMASAGGDTLLVVHDAKVVEGRNCPRASLFILPDATGEFIRQPLGVRWSEGVEVSNDLESAARIPGTPTYLLAESGDDGSPYHRIFLADLGPGELLIREVVDWPVPVVNVEGSAVARAGGQLIFLYAERAHGSDSTQIAWASLSLHPLTFGIFQHTIFRNRDPVGRHARPVSAMEVGDAGRVYVASASDPGVDTGPYRSVVWEIGRIRVDGFGKPVVSTRGEPVRLGTLDGLKVESLAFAGRKGARRLVIGTDDESYGGILRLLP